MNDRIGKALGWVVLLFNLDPDHLDSDDRCFSMLALSNFKKAWCIFNSLMYLAGAGYGPFT